MRNLGELIWNYPPTTFTCLSPTGLNEGGIVSLQWLINGVFLEDLNLNNVNSTFAGGFGTLNFSRVRLDQTPHLSHAVLTLRLDVWRTLVTHCY